MVCPAGKKCQSSVRSCTKRTSVWLSPASCNVGGLGHSSVGRQGRTRRGKLASIWNFSGLSFKENRKSWITVKDCVKWNRRSTLESLGSLKMILTLSGSSGCGSGGRHSDFRSFSSCSVCKGESRGSGEREPASVLVPGAQLLREALRTQALSETSSSETSPTAGTAPAQREHPTGHSSLSSTVCPHLPPPLLC